MPPKIKKIIEIKDPEIEPLAVLEEKVESDDEIQAPIATPKTKRVLTERQKETLAKGREIAHARRLHKDLAVEKKEKMIQKIEIVNKAKKEIEDKLIKTAVAVKKKQLLQEARLKKFIEPEDEEIPDEVVKKIIREKKITKPIIKEVEVVEPPNPFAKYYFL